jgi:hypothetical protein
MRPDVATCAVCRTETSVSRSAQRAITAAIVCGIIGACLGLAAYGSVAAALIGFAVASAPAMVRHNRLKQTPRTYNNWLAQPQPPAPMQWSGPSLPAANPGMIHTVVKETIREVIKVRCPYCGALSDQGAQRCLNCGGKV